MSNPSLNEKTIKDFLDHAEKFKKDPKYETMEPHIRDFFNEEIGKFKYVLEILEEGRKRGVYGNP